MDLIRYIELLEKMQANVLKEMTSATSRNRTYQAGVYHTLDFITKGLRNLEDTNQREKDYE